MKKLVTLIGLAQAIYGNSVLACDPSFDSIATPDILVRAISQSVALSDGSLTKTLTLDYWACGEKSPGEWFIDTKDTGNAFGAWHIYSLNIQACATDCAGPSVRRSVTLTTTQIPSGKLHLVNSVLVN